MFCRIQAFQILSGFFWVKRTKKLKPWSSFFKKSYKIWSQGVLQKLSSAGFWVSSRSGMTWNWIGFHRLKVATASWFLWPPQIPWHHWKSAPFFGPSGKGKGLRNGILYCRPSRNSKASEYAALAEQKSGPDGQTDPPWKMVCLTQNRFVIPTCSTSWRTSAKESKVGLPHADCSCPKQFNSFFPHLAPVQSFTHLHIPVLCLFKLSTPTNLSRLSCTIFSKLPGFAATARVNMSM